MDGAKGIHGLATALFGILAFALTYGFFSNVFDAISSTIFKSIAWFSYALMILLVVAVVPALIIMSRESEATVISAFTALGVYSMGIIFMRIVWPLGDALTNALDSFFPYASQILGMIVLIIIVLTLFITPYAIALMPNTVKETVKGVFG